MPPATELHPLIVLEEVSCNNNKVVAEQEEGNDNCSLWSTGSNAISIMVGAGLLNLPIAFVESGWCGVIMLTFVAILCTITSGILVRCLNVVRWSYKGPVQYGDVAHEAFGKYARILTTFQVHLSLIFISMGYLLITSNYLSILFEVRFTIVTSILIMVVWFHAFIHSLQELAIFSALNLGLAFWVEAVIMGDAIHPSPQQPTLLPSTSFLLNYPDVSISSLHMRLAFSFSLMVSAFFIHSALPTLYNAMQKPKDCYKVMIFSHQVCLLMLYLPICLITYAVYGEGLQAPVFMNLRNTTVRAVAILLFSIHLLFSYVVSLYPVERSFERFILKYFSSSISTRTYSRVWKRILILSCRTFIILVTWILCLCFQNMSHGIFIIIIIPVACLALIYPPLFYMKICWEEMKRWEIIRNSLIIIIGLWVLSAGFISAIYAYFRN